MNDNNNNNNPPRELIHFHLNKIQQKLNAPKSQFNDFGKYKYRSCEDVLEALKKEMPPGGTVTLSDEPIFIGDRYYIKAIATFTLHNESISTTAYAREPLEKKGYDASQITGSASSYARKYALNGLFAIDDSKDSDATNTHGKDAPPPISGHVQAALTLIKGAKTNNDPAAAIDIYTKLGDGDKSKVRNLLDKETKLWLRDLIKPPVTPAQYANT